MPNVDVLARNWGLLALRGIVAVLFGILAMTHPAWSVAVVVLLFGVYAIVAGTLVIAAATMRRRDERHWGSLVVSGVLSIAIGATALLMPGRTALALLYVVAGWAVFTGVAEIVAAVRLRREITGEWLLALAGILSVLLGFVLLTSPIRGGLVLVQWLGAYWALFGIVLVVFAFRLRASARTD